MPHQNVPTRRYSIGATGFESEKPRVGLYLVATPIGHLKDITLRALEVLAGSDRILCEDTRTTGRLLERYGISTPVSPYHEHNAERVRPGILSALAQGAVLALVSDAGMPLVSDPGYRLVKEAIAAGHRVEAIPGASAPLTALTLSGLPTDRFLFGGFLSHKTGERQATLAEFRDVRATLIFFESPQRIIDTLHAISDVLGERHVAVTRELTKLHEEVLRGTAAEIAAKLAQRPSIKGEITLVVAPAEAAQAATREEIDAALRESALALPAGQAAAEVARRLGIGKREAYARLLVLKGKAS